MKERLSLSLEQSTAEYLTLRAQRETNGNVSALVNRLVRELQLAEAVEAEVRWYREHPGVVEDAERERYLSSAA